MPDNQDRTERLRQAPRTDLSMGVRMHRFVSALQTRITQAVAALDGVATFQQDAWTHTGGGGGVSAVIQDGAVFEKGGVNVSAVQGTLPTRMAEAFGVPQQPFFATGLSLVLHPRNPFVPIVHANFRYFALGPDLQHPVDQWFGGGADLTPVYPFPEDVVQFHRTWQTVCARHPGVADYAAFKEACDRYFTLPHRAEMRGVGGIFFDYRRDDPEGTFFFVRDAGRAFLSAYLPIAERRRAQSFGEREAAFQAIRRGRYAEFNLAFDRGTRFGLETGGRTESILMSLPPRAEWRYDWQPAPGSPEAEATACFQPHDWLGADFTQDSSA